MAEELGLLKPFSEQKSLNDWLTECVENLQKKLPDFPDMNTFTSKGVYKRNSTKKYIAFETQIQNPSHVPFPTPSGKIEIFVRSLYEQYNPNLNPLPGYMPAWEDRKSVV